MGLGHFAVMLDRLKHWAKGLKRDVVALWIAARDARTPWLAKMAAGFVAAYALSPIDLIPDFIPVIGYVDDLLIVPLGIALTIRLIPAALMAEFRDQASARAARPRSLAAAWVIANIWIIAATVAGYWIWLRVR